MGHTFLQEPCSCIFLKKKKYSKKKFILLQVVQITQKYKNALLLLTVPTVILGFYSPSIVTLHLFVFLYIFIYFLL